LAFRGTDDIWNGTNGIVNFEELWGTGDGSWDNGERISDFAPKRIKEVAQ